MNPTDRPRLDPWNPPVIHDPYGNALLLGYYEVPPIGCICPPGANRECERVDCPRKSTGVTR